MQYLGVLRGEGVLTCGDKPVARAEYDFDGYRVKPGQVASSGEIRAAPEVLRELFGRRDVQLRTDDGRLLSLRFSERSLRSASVAAHVDVDGELPWQR